MFFWTKFLFQPTMISVWVPEPGLRAKLDSKALLSWGCLPWDYLKMKIPYAFENLPVIIPGNLVVNGNISSYSLDIC